MAELASLLTARPRAPRTRRRASPTSDVEVNCKAQCQKPAGGIFCDGQFVNATDVQACVAYLASKLSIKVDVTATASGSSGCTGDECGAEGTGSVSASGCAAAPGSNNGVLGALGLAGGLGLVAFVRARRRARRTR